MNLLQYIPRPVRIRVRALWLAAKCWKTARELRALKAKYEQAGNDKVLREKLRVVSAKFDSQIQAGRVLDRSTR